MKKHLFLLSLSIFLFLINPFVKGYSFFVLTDIHLDFSYDCHENVTSVCRTTLEPSLEKAKMILHPDRRIAAEYIENFFGSGKKRTKGTANTSKKCAPFARYGCDTSLDLIRAIIQKMEEENKKRPFDAIIILGDMGPHHPEGAKIQVLQTIKFVTSIIQEAFPDKKIIFTLGNDDFSPNYTLPFIENYEYFSDLYTKGGLQNLLSTPEESETFLKGGYFKTTLPGTRFTAFSLNTLAYSKKRKDPVQPKSKSFEKKKDHENDPFEQFEWLDSELSRITVPQSVFIIGHIPPTEDDKSLDCQWKKKYQASFLEIMRKHQNKIIGGFFGHLHTEQYRVFDDSSFFINIHSSISPVDSNNGGIRRYEVNNSAIVDYQQFYFDIYQSNQRHEPIWSSFSWKSSPIFNSLQESSFGAKAIQNFNSLISSDSSALMQYMNVKNGYYLQDRAKYLCEIKKYSEDDYQECLDSNSNDGI